uniref:TNFR-Cys domain-containing protein n=1 Tax=Scleropages formosus TaxID=113540 RepID=A0A8C9VIT5_SCLFO
MEHNHCSACNGTEYKVYERCCPACDPGFCVQLHCTAAYTTKCVPCPESTFTNKPHGRRICNPCTTCDEHLGVKTVKECTASSDTVCGVLEGNYCTDPYEGGCRAAQKHTTCKPGDFIRHPGLICLNPSVSFVILQICNVISISFQTIIAQKLTFLKPGDSVSDSQCGEKNWAPLIAGILGIILVLFLVGGGVTLYKSGFCSKKNNSSKPGKTILMTLYTQRLSIKNLPNNLYPSWKHKAPGYSMFTLDRMTVHHRRVTHARRAIKCHQSTRNMLLDCGRKPEHLQETHTNMGRTCKLQE